MDTKSNRMAAFKLSSSAIGHYFSLECEKYLVLKGKAWAVESPSEPSSSSSVSPSRLSSVPPQGSVVKSGEKVKKVNTPEDLLSSAVFKKGFIWEESLVRALKAQHPTISILIDGSKLSVEDLLRFNPPLDKDVYIYHFRASVPESFYHSVDRKLLEFRSGKLGSFCPLISFIQK
jgi:hypothetical protein